MIPEVVWSLVWAGAVVAVTIACFHLWPVQRRFGLLCAVGALGAVGVVWSLQRSGLALGLYLYGFWIFGVFAQLYSLADRGFSLTILTDFLSAGCPARTRAEIKRAYAAGQGMAYVKSKRMAQIVHGRLVRQQETRSYTATRLGRWIGRAVLQLHALYRFREVG